MPPNPILIIKAPILFGVLRFLELQVSKKAGFRGRKGPSECGIGFHQELWALGFWATLGFAEILRDGVFRC